MPNVSRIELPNGGIYDIKEVRDPSGYVIDRRSYTGIIGSSNDAAGASFYFAQLHPENYDDFWSVTFRVLITAPVGYETEYEITIGGYQNTYCSYDAFLKRKGNLAIYFFNMYRPTETGVQNGYGPLFGIGLRASTKSTDVGYARDVTIELLSYSGGTMEMFDDMVKIANAPGAGANNYVGLFEINASTLGQVATNNTNYFERININRNIHTATTKADGFKYAIAAGSIIGYIGDGYKTITKGSIVNLNYPILFGPANIGANTNTTSTYYIYTDVSLRVQGGSSWTGTTHGMAYLVGTINGNLFTVDSEEIFTTELPTSEDGRCYIPLGMVYNTYCIFFYSRSDTYAFYNGSFQKIVSSAPKITEGTDGLIIRF